MPSESTSTVSPSGRNAATGADAGKKETHPNLILAICCMSLLVVGMDVTIVNVALPAIQHDLRATVSGLQWILDAYTLVVASLLMLAGSVSDRVGRRRVFQVGLLVFTAGSLLCSLAHSIGQLIGFRALQGLGASMLNPVALSIIANAFPEPRARARAVGVWGAVAGASLALGPLIGGALTQSVGWRSIFWINLPICLAAVALTARFVPESKAPHARAFDPVGQLLVFVSLASLTYAVIEGPRSGWTSSLILGLFATSGAALVLFLFYEPRRKHPLLDLRFFRSVPFSSATLLAVCAFASFAGFLFLNALYLQQVRGLSAFDSGLCTLPLAIAMMVCAPLSGRLVGRHGTRPSLLAAGAGFLLSTLDAHWAQCEHSHGSDLVGLRVVRGGPRHGQPGDHQQRRCRYAFIPGRGGCSHCLYRPAGGRGAWRGRRRHGGKRESRKRFRFHPGDTPHLVDHDCLRRHHSAARLGVQYIVGAREHRPGRIPVGRFAPVAAGKPPTFWKKVRPSKLDHISVCVINPSRAATPWARFDQGLRSLVWWA